MSDIHVQKWQGHHGPVRREALRDLFHRSNNKKYTKQKAEERIKIIQNESPSTLFLVALPGEGDLKKGEKALGMIIVYFCSSVEENKIRARTFVSGGDYTEGGVAHTLLMELFAAAKREFPKGSKVSIQMSVAKNKPEEAKFIRKRNYGFRVRRPAQGKKDSVLYRKIVKV